jgi:hypothetical protein
MSSNHRRMSMRVAPSSPAVNQPLHTPGTTATPATTSATPTTPTLATPSTNNNVNSPPQTQNNQPNNQPISLFSQTTYGASPSNSSTATTAPTTMTPSSSGPQQPITPGSNTSMGLSPMSTTGPSTLPALNLQPSNSNSALSNTPLSSGTPHRQSVSGFRTMRSLRSTMDPGLYSQATNGENTLASSTSSDLPAHLARNNLNQPEVSVTRGAKPGDEVSVMRTKEDEEEDQKLREKEKTLSWDDLRKLEDHSLLVRLEILSTESTYVKKLDDLVKHYVMPLMNLDDNQLVEQIGITAQHRAALVSNLRVIQGFQSKFHDDLQKAGPSHAEQTLIQYSHFFRLYSQYATDYPKMIDTLAVLASSKKFQAFTTVVDHQLAGPNGFGGSELLPSYLILPIQRIPRYELLLRELKRHTVPSNPAFDNINKALALVRQTATHINETNKRVENMHKLIALQKRIKGDMKDFVLVQPHRRQLREATVSLAEPHKKSLFGTVKTGLRIVFLFNDIIVWTNTDFEYKTFLNIASISNCAQVAPYVLEIATSEKLVHLNFFTDKGMPPDPSSDRGNELKALHDEWFQDISRLVEEGQAERRRKRTIQSRNDNQRTQTHRLIVGKFSTLDRKQMEELQAESARQREQGIAE